jgi:lipopolysaccharide/colanic/teichoic acid biosynthesis glycosyltransferase
MQTPWLYRFVSLCGVGGMTLLAMMVATSQLVMGTAAEFPIVGRFAVTSSPGWPLNAQTGMVGLILVLASAPLFEPRPRRLLDTVALSQKRVFLALVALAAVGYLDHSLAIPRLVLALLAVQLMFMVPLFFVVVGRWFSGGSGQAILVGDDRETFTRVLDDGGEGYLGYVAPERMTGGGAEPDGAPLTEATDGGEPVGFGRLPYIGGLAGLDGVLVRRNVDTVVLAFGSPSRPAFFRTLQLCFERGVTAKIHRTQDTAVMTREIGPEPLLTIDLEPWSLHDRILKRGFDVFFAVSGLLLLAPISAVIALAIWVEDGRPVLYSQRRTAAFGETFSVMKFRSMLPESENSNPGEQTDRITRVGELLRRTHLDELPQLWSILVGDMSVVGPRAVWTEEERLLEKDVLSWRKRWFVNPGLTGLAQIEGVSSSEPEQKLVHDMEYINSQGFWYDVRIVLLQLYKVLIDIADVLTRGN